MIKKSGIGMALAMTALSATGAVAQNKYGSAAGWDILVKDNMGPGCLITKSNADGTQVQMGIDANGQKRGYMALYTKANTKVAAGEKLSVLFEVDGQQFNGEAKGQQEGGFQGAFVWVNNPDFIYNLAKKKTLTISPKGGSRITVNLAGTDTAFKALRACQDAQ
jgi:hypothetical protein